MISIDFRAPATLTVSVDGRAVELRVEREFKARVPRFSAYAPDAALTSELAVDGVPFDVLISPEGHPMAVVSGIPPEGLLRTLVMSYLEP